MVFPKYLFITYYWFSEGWWLDSRANCEVSELIAATNGSIAVDYYPEALNDERDSPTDVGYVSRSTLRITFIIVAKERHPY